MASAALCTVPSVLPGLSPQRLRDRFCFLLFPIVALRLALRGFLTERGLSRAFQHLARAQFLSGKALPLPEDRSCLEETGLISSSASQSPSFRAAYYKIQANLQTSA